VYIERQEHRRAKADLRSAKDLGLFKEKRMAKILGEDF